MSRFCEMCGKDYLRGNLVPRGIGDRVTRRTLVRKKANLKNKKLVINGVSARLTLCSSCIKRLKFNQRAAESK